MRYLTLYLALCCALVAQTTKVGGSGTTKVGGAGTTKVSPMAASVAAPIIVNAQVDVHAGTNITITYTPIGVGNEIEIAFCSAGGDVANHTVTDNIDVTGANWIQICAVNGATTKVSAWRKKVPSGLTTITATGGTSSSQMASVIHELTGAATLPVTGGETATTAFAGPGTNPVTGNVTPATNNSILFAVDANNGTSAAINGTGTIGTWNYFSAGSHNDDSSAFQILSVPNIVIVTGGSAKAHGWTTSSTAGQGTLVWAVHP